MSIGSVFIKGEGIAALTAACMLAREGIDVSIGQEAGRARPILLLPENAMWLLNDIWALGAKICDKAWPIGAKQVVSRTGQVDRFPYKAWSIAQNELQHMLKEKLQLDFNSIQWLNAGCDPGKSTYSWSVYAVPGTAGYTDFGNRNITAFTFNYEPGAQNGFCVMQPINDGWYFIFPISATQGCLQIMHPPEQKYSFQAVANAVKEAARITITQDSSQPVTFAASPRLSNRFYGENEIMIGQSLARYDPIAGDGTGNAIRSAAWAARIIIQNLRKENTIGLLQNYEQSVKQHFHEHLEMCRMYYEVK